MEGKMSQIDTQFPLTTETLSFVEGCREWKRRLDKFFPGLSLKFIAENRMPVAEFRWYGAGNTVAVLGLPRQGGLKAKLPYTGRELEAAPWKSVFWESIWESVFEPGFLHVIDEQLKALIFKRSSIDPDGTGPDLFERLSHELGLSPHVKPQTVPIGKKIWES